MSIANKRPQDEIWGIQLPAYVILDSAWQTEREAQKRMVTLSHNGYNNTGFFWIPDFKFLNGVELYQVYIGPFANITDAKKSVCQYNKRFKVNTYGVKLSLKPGREEVRCN